MRVADGPNAGLSATTDAHGLFQLAALQPGGFTIGIGAADYVERLQSITLSGDQTVTIELDPVFQLMTTTTSASIDGGGDACPAYWDTYFTDPCRVDYVLNVHHDGTLTAELTSTDHETLFTVEAYPLVDGHPWGPGLLGTQISADLYAHEQYVIQVRKFSLSGGSPFPRSAPFTLTMRRPN